MTKRLAQLGNRDGEIRVLDDGVRPDRFHQFIAVQDLPGVPDQDDERLKRFRREQDGFLVVKKPASIWIESEISKPVEARDAAPGSVFHTSI